jgi:alkanesulfonate monooxygenase SsuD/methylene tetrahydromethanopterin reductase-like flavin-dependent oxidoreductase (luciferase family)
MPPYKYFLSFSNVTVFAVTVETVRLNDCCRMTAHAAYACQAQPGIEESRARFDEALDFILAAAWTNDSFSFDGKYLQARELTVVPRPVQTPHPPVRIAANSPDTFPLAARHRLPIFASPLINPPDKLKAGLVVYRQALPAGTMDDSALAFPVHVASSRAQARAECEPALCQVYVLGTSDGCIVSRDYQGIATSSPTRFPATVV